MPRLAVLGHPVAHSRSPAMQNAALAALGLGEEWSYEAIDVAPDELRGAGAGAARRGLRRRQRHRPPQGRGAGARRRRSRETAREIGAANTLSFDGGEIARREHRRRRPARGAARARRAGKRALVLGAGGAARAVVWALLREGAEVEVWNRTAAARRATSAPSSAAGRSTTPDAGGLRADRQHDRGRARRRGPFDRAAARRRRLRRRPDRRRHGLRRRAQPRCSRRPRRPGATTVDGIEVLVQPGRPLAARSGPAASRRSTRCAPRARA